MIHFAVAVLIAVALIITVVYMFSRIMARAEAVVDRMVTEALNEEYEDD